MTESAEKWEKKVAEAQEYAVKVYEDQVERLEKQIESMDSKEAREVKRVEREVEIDAAFAKHHLDYLAKVIEHEVKRVAKAYEKLETKSSEGASEKAVNRAAEHAVRVENDAEIHVEKVARRVYKHIKRDAKAAAHHVYVGLDKLGIDEDRLSKKAVADAERVEKALERLANKVENG